MTADWRANVVALADGSRTVAEVAKTLGISIAHVYKAIRHARDHGIDAWLSPEPDGTGRYTKCTPSLMVRLNLQNGVCFLCLNKAVRPTIDHLVPKSMIRAGAHIGHHDTRVVACYACNAEKADRPPTNLELRRLDALRSGDPNWILVK